jgi:hypothetical protein
LFTAFILEAFNKRWRSEYSGHTLYITLVEI